LVQTNCLSGKIELLLFSVPVFVAVALVVVLLI
jgi:hypothetical protein